MIVDWIIGNIRSKLSEVEYKIVWIIFATIVSDFTCNAKERSVVWNFKHSIWLRHLKSCES